MRNYLFKENSLAIRVALFSRDLLGREHWNNFRSATVKLAEAIWRAEEQGNLCIELSQAMQVSGLNRSEIETICQFPDSSLVLEEREGQSHIFFQRTLSIKNELKALFVERLQSKVWLDIEKFSVSSILKEIYSNRDKSPNKEQILAIEKTLAQSFQIISGGPGTGKTTTVSALLAVLHKQKLIPDAEEIALVAPTGRAAQRMTESIQNNLLSLFPTEPRFVEGLRGSTIHTLLRIHKDVRYTVYGKERKILKKLVIIDEVSMIGLSLMHSLFGALPPDCKVVLLGDENQLPSVEKGELLRDFLKYLKDQNLNHFYTGLIQSQRQAGGSRIWKAAEAVKEGKDPMVSLQEEAKNSELPLQVIDWNLPAKTSEFLWIQSELNRDKFLSELWNRFFKSQIENVANSPLFSKNNLENQSEKESALIKAFQNILTDFKCLTIYRKGFWGTEALNDGILNLVESSWGLKESVPTVFLQNQFYFLGMPILVTENDRNRKLFNGDTGLVLFRKGELRGCFVIENQLIDFALDTLPPHSPAFFLTVHKSQGSEYKTVCLLLPPSIDKQDSSQEDGLFSRRILYTGITRAKEQLFVLGSEVTWRLGLQSNLQRVTGF